MSFDRSVSALPSCALCRRDSGYGGERPERPRTAPVRGDHVQIVAKGVFASMLPAPTYNGLKRTVSLGPCPEEDGLDLEDDDIRRALIDTIVFVFSGLVKDSISDVCGRHQCQIRFSHTVYEALETKARELVNSKIPSGDFQRMQEIVKRKQSPLVSDPDFRKTEMMSLLTRAFVDESTTVSQFLRTSFFPIFSGHSTSKHLLTENEIKSIFAEGILEAVVADFVHSLEMEIFLEK